MVRLADNLTNFVPSCRSPPAFRVERFVYRGFQFALRFEVFYGFIELSVERHLEQLKPNRITARNVGKWSSRPFASTLVEVIRKKPLQITPRKSDPAKDPALRRLYPQSRMKPIDWPTPKPDVLNPVFISAPKSQRDRF